MPRTRGSHEKFFLRNIPSERQEVAKRLRKQLPKELKNMRWGELKIEGAIRAGYKVDPVAGVVLGKRGKPLKTYTPNKPDGTGRPLVDVRTKLPWPFHKGKIDVQKAVVREALGSKAIHGTTITPINGNVNDTRISNLQVR